MNADSPAGSDGGPGGLEILRFDPDAILVRDPALLLDPHFLGPLHAEMVEELGVAGANVAMLQMGFLHGLQDAFDAVQDAFDAAPESPRGWVAPPLAIRMSPQIGADHRPEARAAISLGGIWPERTEASAVLATLGRPGDPCCYVSAGYTSGWLSGTLDVDLLAIESACSACGAEQCEFTAREAASWRELDDPLATALLSALPFDALRRFLRSNRNPQLSALRPAYDPSLRVASNAERTGAEAVVHIWGPVMVIPFSNGDEALEAVELIGADPATRDVSVVVVDLSDSIVDAAFGSVALEQTLVGIEAVGAEAIFAAVSPLSEAVIADLDHQPLFVLKDLPQAITTAFQIARAQRRPS